VGIYLATGGEFLLAAVTRPSNAAGPSRAHSARRL
jgi:hypothetical protein